MQIANISDLLIGKKTLEVASSKHRGEIKVVKDIVWGTRIVTGNLTQSGGILNDVWRDSLKSIVNKKPYVKRCLILGLGGGTCAKFILQYWVNAKIDGVDEDQKIVNLGIKYLSMNPKKIKIIIKDAVDFLDSSKDVYDLIIVDLYSNEGSPKQFERKSFVKKIKDHLNKEGIVIFNRLRKTKDNESLSFARRLEKVFKKVEYIYPRVNLHMICYTQ